MDPQTTVMDKTLSLMSKGSPSIGNYPLRSRQIQVGAAVVDEACELSPTCKTVVCRTSSLEVFSQACSTYIDCELGWPSDSQPSDSILSSSEFSLDGPQDAMQIARADAQSVDTALPLLLNELEAFIASLREDNRSEICSAEFEYNPRASRKRLSF